MLQSFNLRSLGYFQYDIFKRFYDFIHLNMSGRDFRTTTKLSCWQRLCEFVSSREINCKVAWISDDMQKWEIAASLEPVCQCVWGKRRAVTAPPLPVKEIQKCVIENMFLFIYKIQKRDLKVIQGHKHNPSINYIRLLTRASPRTQQLYLLLS